MLYPLDPLYAHRAKKAGANSSLRIIIEARRQKIPLSWAFALCEQESEFRNITGCDSGPHTPGQYCDAPVTKAVVAHILAHNPSNGVGYTQITDKNLIREANALGGAEIIKNQIRVGFRYFRQVTGGNYDSNAWKYNGGHAYQAEIKAKQKHWHNILRGK